MERKLATVLFIDLVDSTGLVSAADPEVVRRRINLWFERATRCIEGHGGTVEKFAGDAVMAAFGVPRAHEDDAERAVRAAFAVLEAVHELGLEARAGVEAGEVVVEDGDSTFVTGEAVHLAARLQQSAAPGTIVLGPAARRLAAGAVEVADGGPVAVKGRAEPVWTWRAVRALDARTRLPGAPLVGRASELELLENSFGRAVRDRRVQLLTIVGEPGVGKSRLVEEFTAGVERATVLTGRALPYGEGVAYWPLASMVKASAGINDDDPANDAFEKLRLCCESEAVADLLAVALGVLGAADGERRRSELQWAAQRWAAQLAEAQPLLLVFEDVQWAEDPMLDAIEHLARTLRDVPVLILCLARPELFECRSSWGGGNPRASAVELVALDSDESEELADALLARSDVPPAQRALLLEKAEGNPLFLEETARMLGSGNAEHADGSFERIPDTLQTLIAARIDRLDAAPKQLLQRAALIGRVFWRGALDHLSPDLDVDAALDALLDFEFIQPEELSTISGDRAFRFKHVLIRDVAYAGLSKAQRAEDHRVFAAWVADRAGDELLEIRAYHLDRAATLLVELEGAAPAELVREAAAALGAAGERAVVRESFLSARRLFLRTVELEPTLGWRYLAAHAAWLVSDPAGDRELAAVLEEARETGDRAIEGRTLLDVAQRTLFRGADVARAEELADEALAAIDEDDPQARFDVLAMLTRIAWWRGELTRVELRLHELAELARGLGRVDLETFALIDLGRLRAERDDPAGSGTTLRQALAAAEASGSLELRARALAAVGSRELEHGSPERAEAAFEEAQRLFDELGVQADVGWMLTNVGRARRLRGDLPGAERAGHEAVRVLTKLRARGSLVEAQRLVAEILLEREDVDEAERFALAAAETVGAEDAWSRAWTLSILGLVRAAQGRTGEAEALLREGLGVAEGTEYVLLQRSLRQRLESFRRGPAAAPTRS